jgi:hypothetical protein
LRYFGVTLKQKKRFLEIRLFGIKRRQLIYALQVKNGTKTAQKFN